MQRSAEFQLWPSKLQRKHPARGTGRTVTGVDDDNSGGSFSQVESWAFLIEELSSDEVKSC